jgi:hypothetical protein
VVTWAGVHLLFIYFSTHCRDRGKKKKVPQCSPSLRPRHGSTKRNPRAAAGGAAAAGGGAEATTTTKKAQILINSTLCSD